MHTLVAGHSIDTSIISDGIIIDVGARGFEFANFFQKNKVFCIDPDPDVFNNHYQGHDHVWMNLAISNKRGESTYYRNGESSVLTDIYQPDSWNYTPCKTITINDLYDITGTSVDVLKLDCEGGEYLILGEDFRPIPKQITVEWHHHTVPDFHDKYIGHCMNNLLSCYDLVFHCESGMNDLFIRKW